MTKLSKLFSIILFATSTTLYAQTENDSCFIYVPNNLIISGDCFDCHKLRIGTDCDFSEFKFQLLNRWGEIVFETTKPDFEYEPENLTNGLYVYIVTGTTKTGETKKWVGNITILI